MSLNFGENDNDSTSSARMIMMYMLMLMSWKWQVGNLALESHYVSMVIRNISDLQNSSLLLFLIVPFVKLSSIFDTIN